MNSITHTEINSLQSAQLTELLLKLLFLENKKYQFPDCYISVPQNITVADGGEDGRIETSNHKTSIWIKDKLCLFQCKASDMFASQCKQEVLTKEGTLKPQVKEVLDKNGTYILVTTQSIVEQSLGPNSDRVIKIREAIRDAKTKEGLSIDEANTFANQSKIKIYDANLISSWVNEYITAVSYVQSCNGIPRPLGLLIWSEFKTYSKNQTEFKTNKDLDQIIDKLRFDIYQGKNIRIEGKSGIGKTRLICEITSPGETDKDGNFNIKRKTVSDNVVYFDLNYDDTQLLYFVRSKALDTQAILILDNCSQEAHQEFIKECQRLNSKMQLISIDFDSLTNLSNEVVIKLKSEYYKSITEEILKERYHGQLSEYDLNFLIDFSEGNTKLAIDFANASINNINLSESLDQNLIEKLIFGRENRNDSEFKILKTLSIFDRIEYPFDDYYEINPSHYDQLLEGTNFLADFFNLDKNEIRLTIQKFTKRETIERRGNQIMLKPSPLALKLSLLFWDDLAPSGYRRFITNIPQSLILPLSNQLEKIGNAKKAKQLVKSIWGLGGNFSTAEILNSNIGSRLFRSVVTVNPEETVQVLVNHYLDKPKEELLRVVEGRQNLVWALEKLCFRKETFSDAAKVLMCFAVAEIETYYSNNSTSYFTQLFKVFLSGTEVNFEKRIEILKWALKKNDHDFNLMVFKACDSAFSGQFANSRLLGAENRGSQLPLKEFAPKLPIEIHSYYDTLIQLLDVFTKTSKYKAIVKRIILKNIDGFLDYNYDLEAIKAYIISVEDIEGKIELVKTLKRIELHTMLSDNNRKLIKEFLLQLSPNSIEEKIKLYVSKPEYNVVNESYEEYAKKKVDNFAENIVIDEVNLKYYFDSIFKGDQYEGYNFGKKYGSLVDYDKGFVSEILKYSNNKDRYQFNTSFLLGYLSSYEIKYQQSSFDLFIKEKSIFSFDVFRVLKPTLENALKLLYLLEEGENVDLLRISNTRIAELNGIDLMIFLERLLIVSNSIAQITTIIYRFLYRQNIKDVKGYIKVVDFFEQLNIDHNILSIVVKNRDIDLYMWKELMVVLLKRNPENNPKIVAGKIVDFYLNYEPNYRNEHYVSSIAIETLEYDFEGAWAIYSGLFFNNKYLEFYRIFNLSFTHGAESNHPFFESSERNNKVFNWCKLHPNLARVFIRRAPLSGVGGEWFKFTKDLIDEFGNDKEFINSLSANLHSMTTWGSRVPTLRFRKNLTSKLLYTNHTNLKNWAKEEVERYAQEIEMELIKDEEERR